MKLDRNSTVGGKLIQNSEDSNLKVDQLGQRMDINLQPKLDQAINDINDRLDDVNLDSRISDTNVDKRSIDLKRGINLVDTPVPSVLTDIEFEGHSLFNLLGSVGDLENLNDWYRSNSTSEMDTNNKLYGSSSIKISSTHQSYGNVYRTIKLNTNSYYLYVAEAKVIDSTTSRIVFMNANSENFFSNTITNRQEFELMYLTISPENFVAGAIEPRVKLEVTTSAVGQSAYFDGARIYQITQDEKNYIDGLSVVDAQEYIRNRYPHVSTYASTSGIYMRKLGANIAPQDSYGWEVGSLTSEGVPAPSSNRLRSLEPILVVPDQEYTANIKAGYKATIKEYDHNGIFIKGTPFVTGKTSYHTSTNAHTIKILLGAEDNSPLVAGDITKMGLTLCIGDEVLPYEKSYNQYMVIDENLHSALDGSKRDKVEISNGRAIKTKWIEEIRLDTLPLLPQNIYTDSSVIITIDIPLAIENTIVANSMIMRKFNGDIVGSLQTIIGGGGVPIQPPITGPDQFNIVNQKLVVSFSPSDMGLATSGGGRPVYDKITVDEVRAFLMGWKMCDSKGDDYVTGDKYWRRIIDDGGIVDSLPTSTYKGFTPSSVLAIRRNEDKIDITDKLFGSIDLGLGKNLVEIGEGAIVNERVRPSVNLGTGTIYVNEKGFTGYVSENEFPYGVYQYLDMFKNGIRDTDSWMFSHYKAYQAGSIAMCGNSLFDKTATYSTNRIVLDKYLYTSSIYSSNVRVAENITTAQGDTTVSMDAINREISGIEEKIHYHNSELSKILTSKGIETPQNASDLTVSRNISKLKSMREVLDGKFKPTGSIRELMGAGPHGTTWGVSFSPDGKYIAVGHAGAPYISVFRRQGDSVDHITNFVLPSIVRELDFSPDGKYIAAGYSTSPYFTLLKFDGNNLTRASNYTLGGVCWGVKFSPDGRYIALGHGGSGSKLTILEKNGDVLTLHSTPTIPGTPGAPDGIDFSADGKYTVLASDSSPNFTMLEHLGNARTYELPGAGNGVVYINNGDFIAIAHTNSPFLTILKNTKYTLELVATYALPGHGETIAATSDGKYIAVGHAGEPHLTILKLESNTVTKYSSYKLPGICRSLKFSPNDEYLAVGHEQHPYFTLFKWDRLVDPSKVIVSMDRWETDPPIEEWDTSGASAAITGNVIGSTKIMSEVREGTWEIDFFGDPVEVSSSTDVNYSRSVAVSPDGKKIAVGGSRVALFSVDNGNILEGVTYQISYEGRGVSFSPDGKYLAVANTDSPQLYIFEVGPNGELTLTDTFITASSSARARDVQFSPIGDQIVLALEPLGSSSDSGIYLFQFNNGKVSLISTEALDTTIAKVRFVNNGRAIIAISPSSPGTRIYFIRGQSIYPGSYISAPVTAIAISPSEKYFVTLSTVTNRLYLNKIENDIITTLVNVSVGNSTMPVMDLVVTSDNHVIVTLTGVSSYGPISVYKIENNTLRTIRQRFIRVGAYSSICILPGGEYFATTSTQGAGLRIFKFPLVYKSKPPVTIEYMGKTYAILDQGRIF